MIRQASPPQSARASQSATSTSTRSNSNNNNELWKTPSQDMGDGEAEQRYHYGHRDEESLADEDDDGDDDNEDSDFDIEDALIEDRDDTHTHLGANEALESMANQKGKSNLKMAFMNMANSIIGAGIVGQPYALKQAGLTAGLLILIGLTMTVDWTIRLMVTNAKLTGTDTYQATVSKCFGKPGLITISLAQAIFAWMGSAAFSVIIGDTIPHVLNHLFPGLESTPVIGVLAKRNVVIVATVLLIAYPLALNKSIAKLAKASSFAMVSMLVIVLTVVIRGPMVASDDAQLPTELATVNSGILQGVSVISFAFVCHHNSLLILESLKTPTMDRFATVTHWSTGVSMAMCLVMGAGGLLVFKDDIKGNVLNNFPSADVMANISRLCFGFNMLTTFPLEIFVCREVYLHYFFPEQEVSTKRHVITTTVMVVSAMSVSLFTCNLGAILEIVGATTATLMAYVLPPMCYLKLSTQNGWRDKVPSWCCIGFGIMVMILSTSQTLYNLATGQEEEHCVG